jgi:hypothetical protein
MQGYLLSVSLQRRYPKFILYTIMPHAKVFSGFSAYVNGDSVCLNYKKKMNTDLHRI